MQRCGPAANRQQGDVDSRYYQRGSRQHPNQAELACAEALSNHPAVGLLLLPPPHLQGCACTCAVDPFADPFLPRAIGEPKECALVNPCRQGGKSAHLNARLSSVLL